MTRTLRRASPFVLAGICWLGTSTLWVVAYLTLNQAPPVQWAAPFLGLWAGLAAWGSYDLTERALHGALSPRKV